MHTKTQIVVHNVIIVRIQIIREVTPQSTIIIYLPTPCKQQVLTYNVQYTLCSVVNSIVLVVGCLRCPLETMFMSEIPWLGQVPIRLIIIYACINNSMVNREKPRKTENLNDKLQRSLFLQHYYNDIHVFYGWNIAVPTTHHLFAVDTIQQT